jgi:hypothetical protein
MDQKEKFDRQFLAPYFGLYGDDLASLYSVANPQVDELRNAVAELARFFVSWQFRPQDIEEQLKHTNQYDDPVNTLDPRLGLLLGVLARGGFPRDGRPYHIPSYICQQLEEIKTKQIAVDHSLYLKRLPFLGYKSGRFLLC